MSEEKTVLTEEAGDKAPAEDATVEIEIEEIKSSAGGQVTALERELAQAREQASEYLDGWQRARAELANYKKRVEQDRGNARQQASASLLTKLLPVLDDFERAFQALPEELSKAPWVEGVQLVQRKLQAVVEQEGVTVIETEGQSFDPNYHEAVTYEEADGYEEGQIIVEVQKGYKLEDRVLRPALVRVAK